ncbi:MAG: hypothetical protein QXW77_03755 [Candidatus Hadarchaeales archaeon]
MRILLLGFGEREIHQGWAEEGQLAELGGKKVKVDPKHCYYFRTGWIRKKILPVLLYDLTQQEPVEPLSLEPYFTEIIPKPLDASTLKYMANETVTGMGLKSLSSISPAGGKRLTMLLLIAVVAAVAVGLIIALPQIISMVKGENVARAAVVMLCRRL